MEQVEKGKKVMDDEYAEVLKKVKVNIMKSIEQLQKSIDKEIGAENATERKLMAGL